MPDEKTSPVDSLTRPTDATSPESEQQPEPQPPQEASQKNLERPSAEEIYKQVARNAESELKRTSLSLAISGVTGGMFMGLSALGVGIIMATLGNSAHAFILSRMFYPLGFIVVILGRSQLFTENTLYPVALVLAEKKQFWNTMRLWSIVLPSNVLGAFLFASLIALTPALPQPIVHAIAQMGMDSAAVHPAAIFWSGVMGGWIIATTAWLVSGSHSITGSVMIIWVLTFVVGLGSFAHCIATSGEIITAVLRHEIIWTAYPHWLLYAVLGNICGGVFMVTLLEYGQSMAGLSLEQETQDAGKGL
ncbi:MAG: formate/nitrite transporter family protein [Acidobacteriaceae bacterium]|nr:formate/nitrite transporter family protein [Acidobacteriaceae bacterium]